MSECTPEQLRFPPVEGLTVRADFDGGALSSDFGVMVLRGIDQQIGLSEQLARAFDDRRHPSYIDHPLVSLFAQRTYQIACGYADGNDANALRRDPLFKLGLDRQPLDPESDLWPVRRPSRAWRMRPRRGMCIVWPGPSSISSWPATPGRRS